PAVVTATTASSCALMRACSVTGRRANSWTLRNTTLAKTEALLFLLTPEGCRFCEPLKRSNKRLESRSLRSVASLLDKGSGSANLQHESTALDRKSTRLNSSHVSISYAVFCLKKKKNK